MNPGWKIGQTNEVRVIGQENENQGLCSEKKMGKEIGKNKYRDKPGENEMSKVTDVV